MADLNVTLDVTVTCDDGVASALDAAAISDVVADVLEQEGVTRPCAVSVSVVGDRRMRALNARWRGVDAPTDVLSLECERPDDPDLAPDEPCELGDIVLAPAYLAWQAAEHDSTPEAETTLMLVHGLLHLLGYDHLDDADAALMESREDELVARLLGHGAAHVVTTRHARDGGERP